jgi:hypothetical protein
MYLNYGENMLHFEFIDSKLSASVCNDEGEFTIQSYNLQKELRSISNPNALEAYFANAFFKVKELDDDDFKLEVSQKGYGGSRLEQKYGEKLSDKKLKDGCGRAILEGTLKGVDRGIKIGVIKEVFSKGALEREIVKQTINGAMNALKSDKCGFENKSSSNGNQGSTNYGYKEPWKPYGKERRSKRD